MHGLIRASLVLALSVATAGAARADGLAGSPSSMRKQHTVALKGDYSFLRNPKDVAKLAIAGALVPVIDNEHLSLSKVSYAYARPEVRDFVERFAARYHDATGNRLVITSLTRPESAQPRNAHKLSVHPAGMAVDLRIPRDGADRAFIERSLLALERARVLDVTRERSPAHYHIAVFAKAYEPWAARQDSVAAAERAVLDAATKTTVRTALVALSTAPAEGHSLPGLLFGLLALVGMTAPLMYRGSGNRLTA